MPRPRKRTIELTEVEFVMVSDALAAYQQSMEQAVNMSYICLRSDQVRRLTDKGVHAIQLRGRLNRQWEAE